MFEAILGNETAKAILDKQIRENRLPHALLFLGAKGVGKSLFAREIAAHLLQVSNKRLEHHPDFHFLSPEGKSGLHPIEAIREVIDFVHKAPFEGVARVFVIEKAEKMLPTSSNALLKTLEEPTASTYFFLLSSNSQQLLPTILSRLTRLFFSALSDAEVKKILQEKGIDPRFAEGAEGSVGQALFLAKSAAFEELLFPILAKEPWAVASKKVKKIEEMVENEEDPVERGELVEQIFALVSFWLRDQVAKRVGQPLFFPSAPQAAEGMDFSYWAEKEKRLREAKSGVERNMRLSVCLSQVLWD